jgi:hypothetical protein
MTILTGTSLLFHLVTCSPFSQITKGSSCEFLHEFDMSRMPSCYFFTKYGECSNPECMYRHINPEENQKECPWYQRGFCKHGEHHLLSLLHLSSFSRLSPLCHFVCFFPVSLFFIIDSPPSASVSSPLFIFTFPFCFPFPSPLPSPFSFSSSSRSRSRSSFS